MQTCPKCGAGVLWALTGDGKRLPVDLEPVEDGDVLLIRGRRAPIVLPLNRLDERPGAPEEFVLRFLKQEPFRHRIHHRTCPKGKRGKKWRGQIGQLAL